MALKCNISLSFGIRASAKTFDSLNVPAHMLFFTDGDEAPRVNLTIKQDLNGIQIGKNFLSRLVERQKCLCHFITVLTK